jgi:hypothetical protein
MARVPFCLGMWAFFLPGHQATSVVGSDSDRYTAMERRGAPRASAWRAIPQRRGRDSIRSALLLSYRVLLVDPAPRPWSAQSIHEGRLRSPRLMGVPRGRLRRSPRTSYPWFPLASAKARGTMPRSAEVGAAAVRHPGRNFPWKARSNFSAVVACHLGRATRR